MHSLCKKLNSNSKKLLSYVNSVRVTLAYYLGYKTAKIIFIVKKLKVVPTLLLRTVRMITG